MVFSFNICAACCLLGNTCVGVRKYFSDIGGDIYTEWRGWTRWYLFLLFHLFLHLSDIVAVCFDSFSFFIYFNFCLWPFRLSAALYGFAVLLKILKLAELFERRNSIPFRQVFQFFCYPGGCSWLCCLVFYMIHIVLYSDWGWRLGSLPLFYSHQL